ncbi:hypothetical protein L9F63_020260, partial [Diploptera punctata]
MAVHITVCCVLLIYSLRYVLCDDFRMFGAHSVEIGDFPYIVFIVADRVSIKYCTGTILTQYWVLTAAHCLQIEEVEEIPAEKFKVFAGIVNYYEKSYPSGSQIVRGKRIIVHPEYKLFNASNYTNIASYNDLGLLETRNNLNFNSFVSNIPLTSTLPFRNQNSCRTAGFGYTEEGSTKRLKYLYMETI